MTQSSLTTEQVFSLQPCTPHSKKITGFIGPGWAPTPASWIPICFVEGPQPMSHSCLLLLSIKVADGFHSSMLLHQHRGNLGLAGPAILGQCSNRLRLPGVGVPGLDCEASRAKWRTSLLARDLKKSSLQSALFPPPPKKS